MVMSKGVLVFMGCLLMFLCASITTVGSETPRYDISGTWKIGPHEMPFFQNGADVKMVLVEQRNDNVYFYSGTYVSPSKIKGVMARRKKTSNCVTMIEITYTVSSESTMTEDQLYLDSNCDLKKGERLSRTGTRLY